MKFVRLGRLTELHRLASETFTKPGCLPQNMARQLSTSPSKSLDHPGLKATARYMFLAGVEAVLPHRMVKDALRLDQGILTVNQQQYAVNHNIHIVAFGKAVAGMVRATEDVLREHVVGGVASIPCGLQQVLRDANKEELLPGKGSKVKLVEGAKNNLPDSSSLQAGQEIASLACKLMEKDIMLVLISGGGSALLPAPAPPITLDEKLAVCRLLASRGASIEQLNTVRKNLSALKGGRLATVACPAKVISLILSDIIGDPIDLIASAPTVPDTSSPQDCFTILKECGIDEEDLPPAISKHLHGQVKSQQSHRIPFPHALVNNVIIGSNSIAVSKVTQVAENKGFAAFNLSNAIDGEAKAVANMFTDIATYVCERYRTSKDGDGDSAVVHKPREWLNMSQDKLCELDSAVSSAVQCGKPLCLVGAGETTVTVSGDGKGGRNQELALAASLAMQASPQLQRYHQEGFRVALLSAGTDGQDGPTEATGAFADLELASRAMLAGLDPTAFLNNNDSYSFYKAFSGGEDMIITGLTGTNVMDIIILLVAPPHGQL